MEEKLLHTESSVDKANSELIGLRRELVSLRDEKCQLMSQVNDQRLTLDVCGMVLVT